MYSRISNINYIVNDNEQYIDENGIKYPRNFPKDEIEGLAKVVEVDEPEIDTDKLAISGYHIELLDSVCTQVWDTIKSEEVLIAEGQELIDKLIS